MDLSQDFKNTFQDGKEVNADQAAFLQFDGKQRAIVNHLSTTPIVGSYDINQNIAVFVYNPMKKIAAFNIADPTTSDAEDDMTWLCDAVRDNKYDYLDVHIVGGSPAFVFDDDPDFNKLGRYNDAIPTYLESLKQALDARALNVQVKTYAVGDAKKPNDVAISAIDGTIYSGSKERHIKYFTNDFDLDSEVFGGWQVMHVDNVDGYRAPSLEGQ